MIGRLPLALLLLLAAAPAARAWDAQAAFGFWWTPNHDGVVDFTACATGICGTVMGVTALRPDGTAKPAADGRSRCHLELVQGGITERNGVWDSHILNPDNGKTYTIQLHVDQNDKLRMRGYIGIPLFGETVYWTRFSGHVTPECHILN